MAAHIGDAQHGRRIHRMEQTLRRKQHDKGKEKDDAAAHDGIHFQHLSYGHQTNRLMIQFDTDYSIADSS